MMFYRYVLQGGIVILIASTLLSGCGGATPTAVVLAPAETSNPAPSFSTAVQPAATEIPPTEVPSTGGTAAPPAGGADLTTTPEGTVTIASTPTKANPLDLPFLMKIDRISVVVGRGTLLEGRVAHGTLQGTGSVDLLGPQNQVLTASVLAILVSSIARDQVTVGDYAGILVEGVDATQLMPGMLLSESGAYRSYEEALQVLQ